MQRQELELTAVLIVQSEQRKMPSMFLSVFTNTNPALIHTKKPETSPRYMVYSTHRSGILIHPVETILDLEFKISFLLIASRVTLGKSLYLFELGFFYY